MKARSFVASALVLGLATTASAQQYQQCTDLPDATAQDVCQKSQDLFAYMAPQLGTAIAGGNATLGQGSALGFGRLSIGIRGNVVQGSLPQVSDVEVRDTRTADTFETEDQYLPFPAVDAAIGVFPGVSLGLTRVGGVDALVSAYYATDYESDDVRLGVSGGKLKLGYGARVGLISETPVLPGVSVTYLKRDLPTLDIAAPVDGIGGAAAGDTLGVERLAVKTTAWRLVASKRFAIIGLAAGMGKDSYESGAVLRGAHGGEAVEAVPFRFDMDRTNYFGDLMLHLGLLKVVGEVGQVTGGDVTTFNQFAGKQADDSRMYGSVGLRFGW
jgi:hypothetical protein